MEWQEALLRIATSEWFGMLVVVPAVGWFVHWLLQKNSTIKTAVAKAALHIEKSYPNWDGTGKRKEAIAWLRKNFPFTKKIPKSILMVMIDEVIKEIKDLKDGESS